MRALVVAVALALIALVGMRPAVAADASLAVVPASQSVNEGAAFTVTINQNVGVATSGGQTDLTFDPALVQILSVERGPAYTGASFLLGVAPQTKAEAIAEANNTGTLQNVALFFLPGTGSVPAGETTFVTVGMQARPAVGGTSALTLSGAEMLDGAGNPLTVSLTNGEVMVLGPTPTATPPGQTPGPTPTPTATLTPTPTPTAPPTPTPAPDAIFTVTPQTQTVPPGAEFSITVVQRANIIPIGAQTDLTFDPAVVQIVSVTRGQAYQRASLIYGVVPLPPATPRPNAETIAEANVTGDR